MHADGFGDLGDGVLPFAVRAGRLVHAAHCGGLPGVQLGACGRRCARGPGRLGGLRGCPR
jgi:hypothetical protein